MCYYILYYKSDNPAQQQQARDQVFKNAQKAGLYTIYIRTLAILPQCLKDLGIGDVTSGGLPGLFAIAQGAKQTTDYYETFVSNLVFYESLDIENDELKDFFNKYCRVSKITKFTPDGQVIHKTVVKRKRVEEYTTFDRMRDLTQLTRDKIDQLKELDKFTSDLMEDAVDEFVNFSTTLQKEEVEDIQAIWNKMCKYQAKGWYGAIIPMKNHCTRGASVLIQDLIHFTRKKAFDIATTTDKFRTKRLKALADEESERPDITLTILLNKIKQVETQTGVKLMFDNVHEFLTYWGFSKIEEWQFPDKPFEPPSVKPKVVVMMPPKK